jgi:hypothetical protein
MSKILSACAAVVLATASFSTSAGGENPSSEKTAWMKKSAKLQTRKEASDEYKAARRTSKGPSSKRRSMMDVSKSKIIQRQTYH